MKTAKTKIVEDTVDRVFKRWEGEIDKKFNEMFFLSPAGEPTYLTVMLMKKVEESLKAKGLKLA